MNSNDINLDDIMDALESAKEAHNLLPVLPANMKPIHFRVLNAIYRIRDDTGSSRVTDINKALKFSLPNTIRFINELVELNILEKVNSTVDKRVVLVKTTEVGERYLQERILVYRRRLQEEIHAIGESDCITMIETIHKVHQAVKKIYQDK